MRLRFGGRHSSKCACPERKTRTTNPYKRKVVTLNLYTPKIQFLILLAHCHTFLSMSVRRIWYYIKTIGTLRSEDEDNYEYEFSVLSMRVRSGGRHLLKSTCSERKIRARSRPRPPISRSLLSAVKYETVANC